MRKKEIQL